MLGDPEAESPAPRDADEVRPVDAEVIEHRSDICHTQWHRVGRFLLRLVRPTVTTMIDEDEPELVMELMERARDRSVAHEIDGIEESSEDRDGDARSPVVLVVHARSVQSVPGVRHVTPKLRRTIIHHPN
jgi:hypothetical protein